MGAGEDGEIKAKEETGQKKMPDMDKLSFGLIKNLKLSKEKKEKVIILFLLGVFFLLIATPASSFSGKDKKSAGEKEEAVPDKSIENNKKDEYIEELENKLEQTIGGMEGAGKVLVMITLKDNGEKILDKNQPYELSLIHISEPTRPY